nr:ankyrin repeat family protein [Tanacetum cinerariifolium]
MTSLSTESDVNHEDDVTLFVAYDGEWEYDSKEWFFQNSKCSVMVVPKHITLSETTDTLIKQFKVNKELYHLKLEVHYRTGSPWFHVTEIQNDKDLSVFISETSKTSLPLCVSRSLVWDAQAEVDGERRKDYATVFVEFNGEWEYEDKERIIFKNSESSTIFVPKRITLSEIFDVLYKHLHKLRKQNFVYVSPRLLEKDEKEPLQSLSRTEENGNITAKNGSSKIPPVYCWMCPSI